ncbi:MAG: lactoylglutathione lyase [Rhodobacteraceae bacterium]|nr:lactoylglutathione lyase [Paracoccaceae bacterium]
MRAEAILETCLYADDLDAAEAFYGRVFGLTLVARSPGQHVFLRCGPAMLLIFNPAFSSLQAPGSPIPRHGAIGPGHVCFRADSAAEIDRWQAHFRALGLAIEHEHHWPDGARSLYLRDPAGNSVEVGEARIWGLG